MGGCGGWLAGPTLRVCLERCRSSQSIPSEVSDFPTAGVFSKHWGGRDAPHAPRYLRAWSYLSNRKQFCTVNGIGGESSARTNPLCYAFWGRFYVPTTTLQFNRQDLLLFVFIASLTFIFRSRTTRRYILHRPTPRQISRGYGARKGEIIRNLDFILRNKFYNM